MKKIILYINLFVLTIIWNTQIVFGQSLTMYPPVNHDGEAKAVAFTSSQRGVLVGTHGMLYLTTDGGLSWEYAVTEKYDNDFEFLAQNGNYLCTGGADFMLYSSDAGQQWKTIKLPEDYSLSSIALTNTGQLWIAAINNTETGSDSPKVYIWKSNDAGTNWVKVYEDYNLGYPVQSLQISNEGILLVSTPQGLKRSTTGGSTWENTSIVKGVLTCFIKDNNEWYAFTQGYYLTLYKSTDKGVTWIAKTEQNNATGIICNMAHYKNKLVVYDNKGMVYKVLENSSEFTIESIGYAGGKVTFIGNYNQNQLLITDYNNILYK